MNQNHADAILLLEVFADCIETNVLPGKVSPCHRKIVETINASGLATRKRRVGKPSKHAKAIQAMASTAKAVIDRWDTPLWKDAPATAAFINRMRNALDAFEKSRIDLKP